MKSKVIRNDMTISFACNGKKKKYNKEFALVDIVLCYAGRNRNMTDMSKEVIADALPSLYGCPIIGEYIYKDEENNDGKFGSHGGKIIIDDKGIRFEQTTKPYGFITQEAVDTAEWVTMTEKDGHTEHEYLILRDCVVWNGRYEELNDILDKKHNQSMEIKIESGTYDKDGYFVIDKMNFSAACILGTDVTPCFESASIGSVNDYALDSFKQQYTEMLDEYKKFTNESHKEEKKFMDLEKLNAFLSTFTFKDKSDNDVEKYALLSDVTETSFTVIDKEDNFKVYTVEFALDDDGNIVADWNGKVEKKFTIVEADNESAIDLYSVVEKFAQSKADVITEELTISFNEKIDEMTKDYTKLSEELTEANNKLSAFEAEKAEGEKLAHREEVKGIVADFAKKIGRSPKFLVYKAKLNADEVTIDKVVQDLTLMAGQEMINKNSNYSYQPQETNTKKTYSEEMTSRYGHLLDKYRK